MNLVDGFGIHISNNSPMYVGQTGSVRWNGNMQCLEVSTNDTTPYGTHWIPLGNGMTPMIALDNIAAQAITWAMAKQAEEENLSYLTQNTPILKYFKMRISVQLP